PAAAAVPVSWRDVDRQGATGLLQGLAETVDGVLWPAVHQVTGAYLRVEDPAGRVAGYHLEWDPDRALVVIVAGGTGLPLSACDVLRDPVEFVRDVASVA